ncbi:MAG: META domain-containing protein, partial [Anaerolineae bacterium]|nr:META domain-containing protein [Anaerolineae bacterium]
TSTITTVFDNSGHVSGNDGCNSYSGTYTTSGNSMTITLSGISTGMLCGDPIDSQAQAFLEVLASATSYSASGGQLTINGLNGTLNYTGAQPK